MLRVWIGGKPDNVFIGFLSKEEISEKNPLIYFISYVQNVFENTNDSFEHQNIQVT